LAEPWRLTSCSRRYSLSTTQGIDTTRNATRSFGQGFRGISFINLQRPQRRSQLFTRNGDSLTHILTVMIRHRRGGAIETYDLVSKSYILRRISYYLKATEIQSPTKCVITITARAMAKCSAITLQDFEPWDRAIL